MQIIFITFSYRCKTEKVSFLGQVFESDILLDLHVWTFPESENFIFGVWSVCACDEQNSRTNNNKNSKFDFLALFYIEMQFKTFHNLRIGAQKNSNALIFTNRISCLLLNFFKRH